MKDLMVSKNESPTNAAQKLLHYIDGDIENPFNPKRIQRGMTISKQALEELRTITDSSADVANLRMVLIDRAGGIHPRDDAFMIQIQDAFGVSIPGKADEERRADALKNLSWVLRHFYSSVDSEDRVYEQVQSEALVQSVLDQLPGYLTPAEFANFAAPFMSANFEIANIETR